MPADAQTPQLCQRRLQAWTLDGSVPATFAERDARLWSAGRERFELDARTGLRLSAECHTPHERRVGEIARWPALLSPWSSNAMRAGSRLPPLAADCAADGRDAAESLQIEGLQDNALLARAPGSERGLRLSLRALGSEARIRWLVDARLVGEPRAAGTWVHDFGTPGEHTLTAVADSGAWSQVRFRVLR